jgi:hypothetical protein
VGTNIANFYYVPKTSWSVIDFGRMLLVKTPTTALEKLLAFSY